MNIWLINPYGPIPTEKWREYRYTIFGEALSEAGHAVTWWTSNFSHHFKYFRSKSWEDLIINERFKIKLVPTSSYKHNFSFGRALKDSIFAFNTYRFAKKLEKPDIIIAMDNPLTLGYPALMLAKKLNSKIIYDQMDIWPEFFLMNSKLYLKPIMVLLLTPFIKNRNRNYKKIDGIISLAKPYLDYPIKKEPSLSKKPTAIIYNGIDVKSFRELMNKDRIDFGIISNMTIAVFAGTLGPSYDILNLIEVAKLNAKNNNNICIVVAGDGPYKKEINQYIKIHGDNYIKYVGKLKPIELCNLFGQCDIALSAYSNNSNVEMPDKIYDYTAAGLPVINSLNGEVRDVINEYEFGVSYSAGSVDDLYEKLLSLASNKGLRKQMSINSLNCAMKFDKNMQNKKLNEFISLFIN